MLPSSVRHMSQMVHFEQAAFDDLGTPLQAVTFVVVDLETTGGNAQTSEITEFGAVKVRGGEILGQFQTLVRPATLIPAYISMLTGITDAMVADAPPIEAVLPAFLEFASGAVLVAHNAPFDIGFLKAASARLDIPWPGNQVLDTAQLARQVIPRDEVANHKLSSLATLFSATTTPDHRALHDARATVDVLHGLFARVGNLGVHTLEELASYSKRVTPAQRRKRFLADDLPAAPGVYVFKDEAGKPLYVGTSVNIQRRARQYFTASEQRTRMADMVMLAREITPIVCQTALEASVRELRVIAEHKPRFNRRSRFPERALWLKLTDEPFPRLSIVREVKPDAATYVGPFGSRGQAESAMSAVHEVTPLRQCTTRLPASPSGARACALFDRGRCGGPCIGAQSREDYSAVSERVRAVFSGDVRPTWQLLDERLRELAAAERYEDAAVLRDRLLALVRAASRVQRLEPLARSREVVAALRSPVGGWEIVCVRYGRFAGTVVTPRGIDPMPFVEQLRETAEVVQAPAGPAPAALTEETEKVLTWLEQPGVRIIDVDGQWSCPVHGAGEARDRLEPMVRAAAAVDAFADPDVRLPRRTRLAG